MKQLGLSHLRAAAPESCAPTTTTSEVAGLKRLGLLVVTIAACIQVSAQEAATPKPAPENSNSATTNRPIAAPKTNDAIARIRDEGLNHSQAAATLSYLTDVIGPRLTGSPGLKHANDWTREKLESWGLTNAHLEAWGPFGYGWSLQRFSLDVTAPQYFPLKAYPNAWSPGLKQPLDAEVVFFDATNTAQLEKFKGKLKGAVVLVSPVREVRERFDPPAERLNTTNLLELANAPVPENVAATNGATATRIAQVLRRGESGPNASTNAPGGTNSFRRFGGTNAPAFGGRRFPTWTRFLPFLNQEGAALILTPSFIGDAGTIFVASASVPAPDNDTNAPAPDAPRNRAFPARISAYATNAPPFPPQATVAVEDYNRLVRMIQFGEKLKIAANLQVQFHTNDLMAYNTIAEIPGTDLKDEIVMVGAHLDSWHAGTGATDNGAGSAAAMEAVRILKAADLHPRRTVRIGLWSGEEQGILGSKAYVTNHLGFYKTNATEVTDATRSPKDEASSDRPSRSNRPASGRKLVKHDEYEKFSVYFNLDNGTGKIRGVYLQGNEGVRSYFRKWLEPFRDLGAETITPSNTGGTDHLSFAGIGLPGFQFIQDPLDYGTRTHHSNEDVFDRIQTDDLKQAATIMAAFIYNAAMLDEKLPRLPVD